MNTPAPFRLARCPGGVGGGSSSSCSNNERRAHLGLVAAGIERCVHLFPINTSYSQKHLAQALAVEILKYGQNSYGRASQEGSSASEETSEETCAKPKNDNKKSPAAEKSQPKLLSSSGSFNIFIFQKNDFNLKLMLLFCNSPLTSGFLWAKDAFPNADLCD